MFCWHTKEDTKVLKKIIFPAIVIIIGLSGWCMVSRAAQTPAVKIEPNVVLMGATYNGASVSLTGEVPQDTEVLVRFSGNITDGTFLEKGRVLGILWMNTNTVTLHHIPKTYLLFTSSAITASSLNDDQKWLDLGLGFNALKSEASIMPEDMDMDKQFGEFLKLKTHEGLYGIHENTVTYTAAGQEMKAFQCDLTIPCAVPSGEYTVTTFFLKNGKMLDKNEQQLKIKETGLPELINTLAFDHSVIYGILSVLIAIGAGFITGLFFKSSGSH